jgi:hypothetical protein
MRELEIFRGNAIARKYNIRKKRSLIYFSFDHHISRLALCFDDNIVEIFNLHTTRHEAAFQISEDLLPVDVNSMKFIDQDHIMVLLNHTQIILRKFGEIRDSSDFQSFTFTSQVAISPGAFTYLRDHHRLALMNTRFCFEFYRVEKRNNQYFFDLLVDSMVGLSYVPSKDYTIEPYCLNDGETYLCLRRKTLSRDLLLLRVKDLNDMVYKEKKLITPIDGSLDKIFSFSSRRMSCEGAGRIIYFCQLSPETDFFIAKKFLLR